MVIAGIGTLIQLYPVWRFGSRLPIVLGTSFTFITVALGVAAKDGMGALMGAVIVGGVAEGVLGLLAKYWLRFISPVVAATVVTSIGMSLLPVGAQSFAGGQGAADFGSAQNWIVGSVTLVTCIAWQVLTRGVCRSLSVLAGLAVGYVLALCMGMVNYAGFSNVRLFALPTFMPFTPEFKLGPILSVLAIYLVSATEAIGDTTAICASAIKRPVKREELRGAIACDGVVSSVAGCFGCTPITTYCQNVGLATMTGVVNRFTIGTGAVIMVLAGVIPALGLALTTIPQCVLGGCTLMMFGSIIYAGFHMVAQCGNSQRNMVIVATSLSVGLGFTATAEMFNIFPEIVRTVFAENCVAVVFVLAVLLNLVLPKKED